MRYPAAFLIAFLIAAANQTLSAQTTQLPAGTQVSLAVTRPIRASTVKPGDPIYAQTTFPATVSGQMAIPSGTFVEGQVDAITRPTRKSNHATFSVHFTKVIFANGYTVLLPTPASTSAADGALVDIQVSAANDLLLDNGAQIEMTFGAPLTLDSTQVAAAVPLSRPLQPGSFKSATLCRPTPGYPGTPGSPDTVVAGSPGTPPTVIPGASGSPDIVIPGTPATPATVIPGSPGTPGTAGTYCPAPPLVLSSTAATQPASAQLPPKHN